MWTCPRCGCESDGDARFCSRCGVDRFAEVRRRPIPPPAGYFAFRKMISPALIRVANVLGLLACTGFGGYYVYQAYQEAFVRPGTLAFGLLLLFGGNLLWRMLCEILILFFSMHEVLVSIETRWARN